MKQTAPELLHLISRRQLAVRWQVTTETLKRREKDGILPCLKLGTRVRYRITDIEKIEQSKRRCHDEHRTGALQRRLSGRANPRKTTDRAKVYSFAQRNEST